MATFKIVAARSILADGQQLGVDQEIGTITSDIRPDTLIAMLDQRQAITVLDEDGDELDEEAEDGDDAGDLAGLSAKLQGYLEAAALTNRDEIKEFLATGKTLASLEGIGPATEKTILAWLG